MKKLLLLCSLALFATAASATPITPGMGPTPVNDFGTSFWGTLVTHGPVTSFTGKNASGATVWTGTFQAGVVQDANTGHLDFVYQFSVDASSTDGIPRMTATDFTAATTDVGYSSAEYFSALGAGSVAPVSADRYSADTVGFNFNPTVKGQTSYMLVIKTNAGSYTTGTANFLDGGTASLDAYAPTVPEPASLTLLASGLMLFGFKRFRK